MIKVTLINPKARKFYLAQWDDPITGKTLTRSTRENNRRLAERFAGTLETELNAGTYRPDNETLLWSDVRDRYLAEVSVHKREKTRLKTVSMFNLLNELLGPKYARTMSDPNVISKFAAKLRQPRVITYKRKPVPGAIGKPVKPEKTRTIALAIHTIHGHLAELRKVLRWCSKMRLIKELPHIQFPELTDGMKGRPITLEEFERIVEAVPNVRKILPQYAKHWAHFLRGMWLSGLRIEEAMQLHWTDERKICVDLISGHHPALRIQAIVDKAKTFRLLPITPDFYQFLMETPPEQRKGFVFNPFTSPPGRLNNNCRHRPAASHVGRIVTQCGESANVKVNESKFASCHDFRRAFGFRWAKLVLPQFLKELMRHRSIKTTMEYYVGSLAGDAGAAVWNVPTPESPTPPQWFGNSFGNTGGIDPSQPTPSQTVTQ